MPVVYKNYTSTTVTSGGTNVVASGTQQTITVGSSTAFPAASTSTGLYFHVADLSNPGEVIKVINISGTTWTVIRGDEGTTPIGHLPNYVIFLIASAGDLTYGLYVTPSGDSTGVQDLATINSLLASQRICVLGSGNYYINGSIELGSFNSLIGAGTGAGATTITSSQSSGAAILMVTPNPNTTITSGSNGGTIQDIGTGGWSTPSEFVLDAVNPVAAGFAASGIIFVQCSGGTAVVGYSSISTTGFSGCFFDEGSHGTVSTGGVIEQQSNNIINPAITGIILSGTGAGTCNGIQGGNPWDVIEGLILDNVIVNQFGGIGVNLGTTIAGRVDNCNFAGCGGNGFQMTAANALYDPGPGTPTSMTIRNCYSHTNGGDGYFLEFCNYTALIGCAADDNGVTSGVQYHIVNCYGVGMYSCGAEVPRNAGNSFVVSGGQGVSLTSCLVAGNKDIAFWITGSAAGVTLTSCQELNIDGSASASFQVDAGSSAVIIQPVAVTAASYSSGTTYTITGTGGTAH